MKRLNSLTLLAATLLLIGCTEENITSRNNQQQQEEENIPEGLTAFVEDNSSTRTTAEYFDNGGANRGLHFYWTEGDRLWVNTGTALSPVLMQDKYNNINSLLVPHPTIPTAVKRATTAKFYFEGDYSAPSYTVRYTGKGNTVGNKVTIKAQQNQSIANDASHIAESGDCGIATATKPIGGGRYNFTLNHEASYITFLPYSTQGVVSAAKIQKIKVSADQAICGTFDFNDNGISTASRPTAATNNQSIELSLNYFSIPNAPTVATNASTMVIAPGSYTNFTVEYTLYDPVTWVSGTVTKQYPGTVTFTKGKNKKISQDLQVTVYHNEYYMWDAQKHYWFGHMDSNENPDGNYPTSSTDPRYYNNIPFYSGQASRTAANCPNINEIAWYCVHGDPHWDNDLWSLMGHLYAGGMWFKKLSVIGNDQSPQKTEAQLKALAPDNKNYTIYGGGGGADPNFHNNSIKQGRPSASKINNYFYLPALGSYSNASLYSISGYSVLGWGFYWSCTSGGDAHTYGAACYLLFYKNSVHAHLTTDRNAGNRIWKTDDRDNKYRPIGI